MFQVCPDCGGQLVHDFRALLRRCIRGCGYTRPYDPDALPKLDQRLYPPRASTGGVDTPPDSARNT